MGAKAYDVRLVALVRCRVIDANSVTTSGVELATVLKRDKNKFTRKKWFCPLAIQYIIHQTI